MKKRKSKKTATSSKCYMYNKGKDNKYYCVEELCAVRTECRGNKDRCQRNLV